MSDAPSDSASPLRPLNVVMLCLVIMCVAGGSLLLSASDAPFPVDGAIEWHEGSPLRAVVALLCLDFQIPTNYAGDVKTFILGIGSGLSLLVLGLAVAVRPSGAGDDWSDDGGLPSSSGVSGHAGGATALPKAHVSPRTAAQLLIGLFLLWSFASSRWSPAPDLALRAGVLLTIYYLWSAGIGHGLGVRGARFASRALLVIATVSAAVAVWYFYGRNPALRAKFPFGNPTFLAASLIPGVLVGASLLAELISSRLAGRSAAGRGVGGYASIGNQSRVRPVGNRSYRDRVLGRDLAIAAAVVVGLSVCAWAMMLSASRGAAAGIVAGLLAMAFFALRGRRRVFPVALAVLLAAGGWLYARPSAEAALSEGRGATLRFRGYAWDYAWRMFSEQPVRGQGQGSFTLLGDTYASGDVLADPDVFTARIAHVHNEWLEVLAELGSVGFVLLAAGLVLTLAAGSRALADHHGIRHRWALLGLMGALVGLVAEETFGVGLRTTGVPTLFYTVVGLVWALSGTEDTGSSRRLLTTPFRRRSAAAAGVAVGLAVVAVTQQDFSAARNSYRAQEAFAAGDWDKTIRLSSLAVDRLNPQRKLANLYRLSEAHLYAAESLQMRGSGRARRARRSDPPDERILSLAAKDYELGEVHCEQGSRWLKELVIRSPGYLNQGRLAYRFSMARARYAAVRQDGAQYDVLIRDAVAAAQRELERQPYSASLAVDFVRAYLTVADPTVTLSDFVEVLARPLRRGRVPREYVALLEDMARSGRFEGQMKRVAAEARLSLLGGDRDADPDAWLKTWAPERLRLAATDRFLRGDYGGATLLLERAAPAYDRLGSTSPLGAAGCYAELADCRFFLDPLTPEPALAAARRALDLAPRSLEGRKLLSGVKARMVIYHLALNDEDGVRRLLRETATPSASSAAVDREMGLRYRLLCESLLTRGGLDGATGAPSELLSRLRQWSARSLDLAGDDASTHYVAAEVALSAQADDEAAGHLRRALTLGLSPDVVRRFLDRALAGKSESRPMAALTALRPTPAGDSSAGQQPPGNRERLPDEPRERNGHDGPAASESKKGGRRPPK